MNSQFDKSLITNYVYGTLRAKDLETAEKLVGTAGKLQDFYESKIEERDFLLQLVPDKKISSSALKSLKAEIAETMQDVYPKEKVSFTKKFVEFLDKPIFTIRY